jgi:hypothetical protein
MRVLNEVISLPDRTVETSDNGESEEDNKTNFIEFDETMTSIFENVFDPGWMRRKTQDSMSNTKT